MKELVAKALELWSHETIEEALGRDADHVLPHAVRLAELRARIPRYQLAMLEYLAEQQRTTISSVLTEELDGIASSRTLELAGGLPGFMAALEWPDGEPAQLPC